MNVNHSESGNRHLIPQHPIFPLMSYFFFTCSPNAEGDLQQSAKAGDEEDGADEVALREAVVLQTQPLRQD